MSVEVFPPPETLSDGSRPKTDDQSYAGFQIQDIVLHSGATLPTSPSDGQLFSHATTGRDFILKYNSSGAKWVPIYSDPATPIVFYVDSSGTDTYDSDQGTASGTSAFATVQYAIDQIPRGATATIYLANETYSESPVIVGKASVTFEGILSTVESLTAGAGSVQGTGATRGTVVRSSGTWTVNARQYNLVRFTSGVNNGITRLIESNTTTTLTVFGCWPNGAPAATDTFVIEDWGTQISGFTQVSYQQTAVIFNNIYFNDTGTHSIEGIDFSSYTCNRCKIEAGLSHDPYSSGVYDTCYMTGAAADFGAFFQHHSNGTFYNSYLTGPNYGVRVLANSTVKLQKGTSLNGHATYGVWADRAGIVRFRPNAAEGYNYVTNCGTGIRAERAGQVVLTTSNQYSGNTPDEDNNTGGDDHGYID